MGLFSWFSSKPKTSHPNEEVCLLVKGHRAELKKFFSKTLHNPYSVSVLSEAIPHLLSVARFIHAARDDYKAGLTEQQFKDAKESSRQLFDTVDFFIKHSRISFDSQVPASHRLYKTQVFFVSEEDSDDIISLAELLKDQDSAVYAQFLTYYKETWHPQISSLNKFFDRFFEDSGIAFALHNMYKK